MSDATKTLPKGRHAEVDQQADRCPRQNGFVDRLQQTRAEVVVNLQ
jgi:hypothetical protein